MKKLARPLAAAGIAFLAASGAQAQEAAQDKTISAAFNESVCVRPAEQGSYKDALMTIALVQSMSSDKFDVDFVFVRDENNARTFTMLGAEKVENGNELRDLVDNSKLAYFSITSPKGEHAYAMASNEKGCEVTQEAFDKAKAAAVPLKLKP